MGVTIHFEGKLRDESAFRRAVAAVEDFARQNSWPSQTIDEPEARLARVKDEQDWDYVGPTRGVWVQPHPNSDPLRFEFDSDLYVQEYCKTQFAPPEVHVSIVDLLRRLLPDFVELSVVDEGEFWDSSDPEILQRNLNSCFSALDNHLEENPNLEGPVRLQSGRIVDLVSRE